MGLSLNLCRMIGAQEQSQCPECGRIQPSHFDAYDVEAGNPNPVAGEWFLDCYCEGCGVNWTHHIHLPLENDPIP